MTKANTEKLDSLSNEEFRIYQSLIVDPSVDRQKTLDHMVEDNKNGGI